MCVVSMITDHFMQKFPNPQFIPYPTMEEIKELMRKAALYDQMTGQPDCPAEDKKNWLDQFYNK